MCMLPNYATEEFAEDTVVKADVIAECLAKRPLSHHEYYAKHGTAAIVSVDPWLEYRNYIVFV